MTIKIMHSDDHTADVLDEVGMTFMTLATHRLNTALKENGIDDSEQRQEICARFMFGLAYDRRGIRLFLTG